MNMSPENAGTTGPEIPSAPHPTPGPPPGPGAPPPWPHAGPTHPPYGGWATGQKSPFVAGLLSSLMPGLGQIYLGYYQRGFVHALAVACIIASLCSGIADGLVPLFAISLAFIYFYNIVDAARRASLYNHALAGMGPVAMPQDFKMPAGRPSLLAGALITLLGLIFLSHTRFDFNLDWLADWWPAVIVIIGANMILKALREKSS
jgi:hypothetical protein